jgi:putative hydroxymethylpyrimidine transport system permease protein
MDGQRLDPLNLIRVMPAKGRTAPSSRQSPDLLVGIAENGRSMSRASSSPAATGSRAGNAPEHAASPPRPAPTAARLRAALVRLLLTALGLVGLWWVVVLVARPEPFMLPGPDRVAAAFLAKGDVLMSHALVTFGEMLLGLAAGVLLGCVTALAMAAWPRLGRLIMPAVVVIQSMPVFALAPVLVLWLGFGLASKVAMAALIIFFPVAAAFHDGLNRTEPGLLDLGRLYDAGPLAMLRLIRVPAALPGLVSGLRMAAALAPVGAVIGEWVGASQGLGLLMLHSNARMQTETTFAAVFLVAAMAVALKLAVDDLTRRLVPWAETAGTD